MDTTCSIILAAGKGTRLKSDHPKVLHEILGYPIVYYSIDLVNDFSKGVIAIVGHGRDKVIPYLDTFHVNIVVQEPQLGTGHAIIMAKKSLAQAHARHVLILPGDMPLIRKESITGLLEVYHTSGADMGILTAHLEDPFGYGRIVRDKKGKIKRIVEHNDAKAKEKNIDEINTSVYVFNKAFLLSSVERICPDNTKGEFYLTDVVAMAKTIVSFTVTDPDEAHGINSRGQLAFAQAKMQQRINTRLMESGVTLQDPSTTWISPATRIDQDVQIWPNVHILGKSQINTGVRIMPNTWIKDSGIGQGAIIGMGSVIENTSIEPGSIIAPYTCRPSYK
jgi:bifunctional UDP-N-acetylglucosamine pyrophosphorylase / glucosamine-1-phosphate N-acetyltransferase